MTVELNVKGLDDNKFTIEEIYFLNLDDFSILSAKAIHKSLDYNALRKALADKWQEIQNEMPDKNWAPLQAKMDNEEEIYEEEYEEREPEPATFFTDSLISYAIQFADLRKAEITYTGAGVLVVLHDAIPWFQSKYETPMKVQLHLNPYEAKEAIQNFKPYRGLQNAAKPNPGKLSVDPYDLFYEVRFLNLPQHYINYMSLDDTSISAIVRYYKNNPTDSQYTQQVNYKNGRATHINSGSRNDIPSYDSIFWQGEKVKAVISQKSERNYDEGSGYVENRYLHLQVRDQYGNTKWYFTTENSFYMHHYSYFDDKVALYRYSLLSPDHNYEQKPYWFKTVENGLCEENGLCAKVDEKGRPVVSFNDYYAYDGEKLVQILGDRESSTLFYYDESERLSEVLQTERSPQTIKLFYEEGANLPHRIEHIRPNQSHPQNFYQVIHRW